MFYTFPNFLPFLGGPHKHVKLGFHCSLSLWPQKKMGPLIPAALVVQHSPAVSSGSGTMWVMGFSADQYQLFREFTSPLV